MGDAPSEFRPMSGGWGKFGSGFGARVSYIPCLKVIIAHHFTCGKKKNLVKYQKVLKYYENDCRSIYVVSL